MSALQIYQLVIHKNDRLLGHFESKTPWSREAVDEVASALKTVEGIRVELFIAADERRIVESGPSGIKVLASEYVFKPLTMGS